MAKKQITESTRAAAALAGQTVPDGEGWEERSFGIPLKKAGDVLTGVYQGKGPKMEVKKGKKTSKLDTHVVRMNGVDVQVLETSQLGKFFASVSEGDEVWIRHNGEIKAGNFGRVNDYTCKVRPAKR